LRKTLKSQRELARELGVSQATISQAIRLGW
jgi:DNA-binding GntR family transcriptional regulator